MAISSKSFGRNAQGQEVTLYTMTNASGASVSMMDYGATVTSIRVPDAEGKLGEVALGFDDMRGYLADHGHMGETIGRYGNRIARGHFILNGKEYPLATNNGVNHLHGGKIGYGVRMWEVTTLEEETADTLAFHLISPDGEEGYPGTLDVNVTYQWTANNDLIIRYRATTDQTTICNLTNHTYFNLAGVGDVSGHELMIDADVITPVDSGLIPTGGYMPVADTQFDFREFRPIFHGLDAKDEDVQLRYGNGYDHNFVLRKGCAMGMAAVLYHEPTGRTMEVITDQPGVQFYTGNFVHFDGGHDGIDYRENAGLCLETQHYPDSPNNPQFPSVVLQPGEQYDTTTIYAFRIS